LKLSRCLWLYAFATACLSLSAAHAGTALFVDAAKTAPAQIQALQLMSEAEGFWIGVEHQDVASAKPNWRAAQFDATQIIMALVSAQSAARFHELEILGKLEHVDAADFALQSIACDSTDEKLHLPAILKVARANLVRQPRSFLPILKAQSGLHAVPKNQWLTQRAVLSKRAHRVADPQIQQIVNQLNGNRWFAALSQLATWKRNSFSPELDLARDWLAAEFTGLGQNVQTPSFNVTTSFLAENVVATQLGTTLPNEWVLVGAHYDSTNSSTTNTSNPSPGAEDNASGCAGVLEMARVLSQYQFKRTLKFVCFAGEEQGLIGSEAFAATAPIANIKLAVLMDMIGYSSDTRYDVLLETSSALSAVFVPFQTAAADYSPGLAILTSTNPFGSDHMPFINRSVPSLLLIEDEWDTYGQYHRSTDTPSNVSNAVQQGPAVLKMAIAVLAQKAELVSNGVFANGFE
jgi:Peptidase family M28